MKIGVVFPQTEIGPSPLAVRDYAQAAEGLGYDYLMTYDHVLGANPDRPGGWNGPYTHLTQFHETFVLFGYLAGLTQTIEFTTGILILPQRQTALVAKQAAEIAVLSNNRLRLGVGIGWNAVEYESLGKDFHTRGARIEEQVEVLRALWAQPLVTISTPEHSIPDAGLNPLPTAPISVWFGGSIDTALRRLARVGDGWIPNAMPLDKLEVELNKVWGYVAEAGRSAADFGVDYRIHISSTPQSEWANQVQQLAAMGVTHVAVSTMGAGFTGLNQHLDAIVRFKAEVG